MSRQAYAAVLLLVMSSGCGARCFAEETPVTTAAPEVFAPGVISGPANDGAPTFTPDGNTLYFARSGANWGFILESHKIAGRWTEPVVAPFSGQFSDSQPTLSPDGRRLMFVSTRSLAAASTDGSAPKMVWGGSAVWEVDRVGREWGEPFRLPETINLSPRVFKPTIAADGSLYFMAQTADAKTWRLYRSQYSQGTYLKAEPLSFSDGNHTDVDPEIAPDESFLIFSSAGRAKADDAHEHLYIVFKEGARWGSVTPLRYEGDYEKNPTDDGEANLSPDHRLLYFTSGRVVPVHRDRTREQAAEDFKRLNLWDNSNSNVWSISLEPWLSARAKQAVRGI
jgi:Tol biopolymer transport system component